MKRNTYSSSLLNKMKAFIFFGALCAVLLVSVHAEWEQSEEECVHELKLDKAEMQKLEALDIVPEDNEDFNKFMECDWKKEGSLDKDGKMDWDKVDDILLEEFKKEFGEDPKISEFFTAMVLLGVVEECKEEKIHGATPGQLCAKVQNCVVHKIKKLVADSSEEKK